MTGAGNKETPKKPRRTRKISASTSSFIGRAYSSQTQALVYKLYKYFLHEKENHAPLLPFENPGARVRDALQISKTFLAKCIKLGEEDGILTTPGKERERVRPKRNVDDFTKAAIKNLIYEFHRLRKHTTIEALLRSVKERGIEFYGGKSTFVKILHEIGFEWKKKDGTRYLLESPRIVQLRLEFLRRFKDVVDSGTHDIIFLDETWVFQFGSMKCKEWQDEDVRSCPTSKSSTGERYVVIHCGGNGGFVEGAGLIYSTGVKPKPESDYHGDVNADIFLRYFKQKVLPNLKRPSVIVLDNASYHKKKVEGTAVPPKRAKKEVFESWLKAKNIPYDKTMTATELHHLCQINAGQPVLQLHDMMKSTEHKLLFLPPYHAFFNAIELVWGIMKRYYDAHIGRSNKYSFEMANIIFEESIKLVTPDVWRNCCAKIKERILEAYENEIGRSLSPFQIIIRVGENDSDSDTDSDDEMLGVTPLSMEENFIPDYNDYDRIKNIDVYYSSESLNKNLEINEDSVKYDQYGEVVNINVDDPELNYLCGLKPLEPTVIIKSENSMTLDDTSISGELIEMQPVYVEQNHCSEANYCDRDQPEPSTNQVTVIEDDIQDDIFEVPPSFNNIPVQDALQLPATQVLFCRFKINFTVHDLKTLEENCWLNDQVINVYLGQLIERGQHDGRISVYAFSTFFYHDLMVSFEKVKTATQRHDIFKYDLLFIPIHLVNHWALVVVNFNEKSVVYCDSMGGRDDSTKHILKFLQEAYFERKKETMNMQAWISTSPKDLPQQVNGYDCGVFVCLYARCLSEGLPLTFDAAAVRSFRERMMTEILKGSMLTAPPLPVFKVWGPVELTNMKDVVLISSATISQRTERIFSGSGNAQCTAIATYAICAVSLWEQPLCCSDIDNIVVFGDKFYWRCKASASHNFQFLSTDDLLDRVAVGPLLTDINIIHHRDGNFNTTVKKQLANSVISAISVYKTHLKKFGCLFIGHSKTVSFIPKTEDQFWFFNSHAVTKNNTVCKNKSNGVSRLFLCNSIPALCEVILRDHPRDNAYWQIFVIQLLN